MFVALACAAVFSSPFDEFDNRVFAIIPATGGGDSDNLQNTLFTVHLDTTYVYILHKLSAALLFGILIPPRAYLTCGLFLLSSCSTGFLLRIPYSGHLLRFYLLRGTLWDGIWIGSSILLCI